MVNGSYESSLLWSTILGADKPSYGALTRALFPEGRSTPAIDAARALSPSRARAGPPAKAELLLAKFSGVA